MKTLPKARNEEILVQELGKELLVFDLKTSTAYSLNETSMIVFNACAQSVTLDELKSRYLFTDDLIYFALDELNKKDLLADEFVSPLSGVNRREVIRKVGFTSLAALPVIASLVAPTAAQSSSVCRGNAAPNTPVICTRGIPACEITIAQQFCASCRATAITPSANCVSNPDFPYECRCAPPA